MTGTGTAGKLEKLKITAYKDEKFSGEGVDSCKVAINPEKYSRKCSIQYNKDEAVGKSGGSPKFSKVPAEVISFELVFDATGAIPAPAMGADPGVLTGSVDEQIKKFTGIIYEYQGDIHSPYYLELSWGDFTFQCRLQSLDFNYTLFKPDGSPLRAKANVTFVEFQSEQKLAAEEDNQSPDVTHMVTVKHGETLPVLCYRIYKDSSLYTEIARVNNLVDFRLIEPGRTLIFPPVKTA